MKVNDINYWNKYYNNNKKLTPKSNFALFIKKKFVKKNFNILELGTGNGRDAFYLSKFFKSIIAVDQSSSAIKENRLKLYLPKYKICIEYDGELHYNPYRKSSSGTVKLMSTKKNDKIKNEYCKKRNIKLIRIPFWEKKNIKKILEESL